MLTCIEWVEWELMKSLGLKRHFRANSLKVRRDAMHSSRILSLSIIVGLAAAGIGAHHAGLELSDKRLVEELFMSRVLRVVVATSVSWSF
jgi:replicative superfamily II helicase